MTVPHSSHRRALDSQKSMVWELTRILMQAGMVRLTPLVWEIPAKGQVLNAKCVQGDAAKRRDDFVDWAQILGVAWDEQPHPQGGSELLGIRPDGQGQDCVIILYARLHPETKQNGPSDPANDSGHMEVSG